MSSSDLPPPRPGPLPPGKSTARVSAPPPRQSSSVLDLAETRVEPRVGSGSHQTNRLAVVAFTAIIALLVTIIVLLWTNRDGNGAPLAATQSSTSASSAPSAESTIPVATTARPDVSSSTESSPPTTSALVPRSTEAPSVDVGPSTKITQASADGVADQYLAASSANDPNAFVNLWSYPANRYGEVVDASGMRAAAEDYFASNPQRSFQRIGPVSIRPGPSGEFISFEYRFNHTRSDGAIRCGVRELTLEITGGPQWLIAGANETKVSDCA